MFGAWLEAVTGLSQGQLTELDALECPAVRDGRAFPAVTAMVSGDGRKVMLPG